MVAKISYGSSLYGALAYNGEKVNEGVAKILETNKVFCPADGGHDITACMQDFMAYMPSQIRTKKPIIHISLNPHPDDKLSDEQFSVIALEYIEKMGYGNQPFVVYKHEDIDRHHLHIVTLAVDETGRKINDGNNFYASKRITREMEQKYGLHPADRKQFKEAFRLRKVRPEEGSLKKQLASVIKPAAKFYHCPSFKEYRTLLSTYIYVWRKLREKYTESLTTGWSILSRMKMAKSLEIHSSPRSLGNLSDMKPCKTDSRLPKKS